MRILVTGGFGFLGSYTAEYFAACGHEVFILSKTSQSKAFVTNLSGCYQKSCFSYTVIEADLVAESSKQIAHKVPLNIDVVVHAASFNDTFAKDYSKKALQANVLGTQNILEAIATKEGPSPLFIYVSTFHVYGQNTGIITESGAVMPTGDYGLTHYLAEEYCRLFHRRNEIPCIITRCTNGYGAPLCTPFGKWYLLLADMCYQAFTQGSITLKSSPSVKRDFIWMGDIARTIGALASRRDLAGNTYNIGRGLSMPIGYIADIVANTASQQLERSIQVVAPPEIESMSLDVDVSSVYDVTGISLTDRFEEETQNFLLFLSQYGKS